MLDVVFMGTPEFAVPALESVHRVARIKAVYTQPDRPVGRGLEVRASAVKTRALELGLSVRQPEKLTLPGEYEKLAELKPALIVVVAYGQILKKNVLDCPRLGCVNIHSSLLPRWRGAAPIQWAILGGDSVSGVTTMKLVEKLDAGDILLQETTPISSGDTAESLHDRLAGIGARLIERTLTGLESGELKGVAQDETKVTYASKLAKEMEWLDPAETAEALGRRVRALNPWPGTSAWVTEGGGAPDAGAGSGVRLKIKSARLHSTLTGQAGRLYERHGMVLLGATGGSLECLALQWDGKKEVDAAAFLNGLRGRNLALPLTYGRPA